MTVFRPTLTVQSGVARRFPTHAGARSLPPFEPMTTNRPSSSTAYSGTSRGEPERMPVVVSTTLRMPKLLPMGPALPNQRYATG